VPADSNSVKVKVAIQQTTSHGQTDTSSQPRVSGAGNLRLFRDGVLVAYSERNGKDFSLDASGAASLEFTVSLPHSAAPREIEFTAYAQNSGGVNSLTAKRLYKAAGAVGTVTKRAYIISMGVNFNEANVALPLMFAADDAQTIAHTVAAKLRDSKEYSEVVAVELLTDKTQQTFGTKQNLAAVLAVLAGRPLPPGALHGVKNVDRIHKTGPDDFVFVFFSGHGYALGKEFYMIPFDTGKGKGDKLDAYLEHYISNKDLAAWFRDIDAMRILLVMDACDSAAAVDPDHSFRPGPMGVPGMGQLAYDKGMSVLAAADEETQEAKYLKSGYLTYTLVHESFSKYKDEYKGKYKDKYKADFHPIDGKVTFGEWLTYAVKQLPVVKQAPGKGGDGNDAPILFNFLWKQPDVTLTTEPVPQNAPDASSPQPSAGPAKE
jgi:hypothetical protein